MKLDWDVPVVIDERRIPNSVQAFLYAPPIYTGIGKFRPGSHPRLCVVEVICGGDVVEASEALVP